MGKLRQHTWIITLVALALLLLARQLQKRESGRKQILIERSQELQADARAVRPAEPEKAPRPPSTPVAPIAPTGVRFARTDDGTATLSGQLLTWEAHEPVAGVRLRFAGDADAVLEATTARDGGFSLRTAEAARWTLTGLSDGWTSAVPVDFRSEPGVQLSALQLLAKRGADTGAGADTGGDDTTATDTANAGMTDAGARGAGTDSQQYAIAGRVRTTPEGAPLQAVIIEIKHGEYDAPANTLRRTLVLDPAGQFSLVGFAPGTYRVQAYAEGRAPAERRISLPVPPPQDAELQLLLGPGGRVHGRVTEADGTPVAGAQVRLRGHYDLGEHPLPLQQHTKTDATGRYALPGFGAGLATIEVRTPDGRTETRDDLRAIAGQDLQVPFTLTTAPKTP